MKAFFLERYGEADRAFVLRDCPEPKPTSGEYLLRTEAFGLNFADVMARRGVYRDAPPNPCILGYDVVGRVVKAPDGGAIAVGTRVVALTRFGGYAEYVVAREEAMVPVPEDVPAPQATALATQGATAFHCALGTGVLFPGELALVSAAAGGVGSLLVQICRHHGLRVAGLGSPPKRDTILALGAETFLDRTEGPLKVVWKRHYPKERPDVIFDSLGGTWLRQGLRLLNRGGRIVAYGAASSGGKRHPLHLMAFALSFGFFSPIPLIMQSRTLAGVNMLRLADCKPYQVQRALQGAFEYFRQGILKPLPGHLFPHTELAEAHKLLESGRSEGKVAVQWI